MILAYRILTTLLYPLLFIFLFLRILAKKEDLNRFKEKILPTHFNVKKKVNTKLIWFHAASIGEFKSVIPIIEQLSINNSNLRYLITTTTLSSASLASVELKKFENIEHRYFPFDVPFLIDRFLYLWRPDNIFLVDSEVWPNLILKSKKYNIPIALLNGRLTQKSLNRWLIFPNTAKKIFGKFALCLCSNIATKKFLEKLNIKNVYFEGNIKLINLLNNKESENKNQNIFLNERFWLAASTHRDEDIFCLKTHLEIKKKYKKIITLIAPRHIDNVEKIKLLAEKLNLKVQILNKNETILSDKEIIIINYFGALNEFFKNTKSVFIGKSMVRKIKNQGGQNPLEAVKFGCKIYHGPYVYNFEDIYKILKEKNIGKKIVDHKELSFELIRDLQNPLKESNLAPNSIKIYSQKTLFNSMRLIENFLKNEIN